MINCKFEKDGDTIICHQCSQPLEVDLPAAIDPLTVKRNCANELQRCELTEQSNTFTCGICARVTVDDRPRVCKIKRKRQCVHRGQEIRREKNELCGCRGSTMPIYSCKIHTECSYTKYKSNQTVSNCLLCDDMVAQVSG